AASGMSTHFWSWPPSAPCSRWLPGGSRAHGRPRTRKSRRGRDRRPLRQPRRILIQPGQPVAAIVVSQAVVVGSGQYQALEGEPMSDTNRYSGIAIINHWLTAVLVVIMLLIGFAAAFAPGKDVRGYLMGMHVSVGFFVLLFVLWRVFWRLYEGFPPNVGPTGGERWLAWLVHRLILISLVVQVLTGPLAIFLGGHAVNVFGWFSFRIPV